MICAIYDDPVPRHKQIMSSISNAIQAKCLAFGDRIIKLNDYLLEQAARKETNWSQTSDFGHQTSFLISAISFLSVGQ